MKALVLAGGFPQISLIKELQKRGYFVILADYNDEPVAKKFCDKFYKVSTLDIDAIKNVAISENVDIVITVCTDQALLTVAKVSEDLGLPCYIDYKTALNVTNKQYMKKVFIENGIPTARFVITDDIEKCDLSSFRYPIISKPVDCNSSKGVIKSETYTQLVQSFAISKELSRTKTAIVEEFIDGTELTVDAMINDGVATLLSVSVSEKIKDNNKFVIYRTINPANISNLIEDKIKDTIQKIADAFKLRDCPLLVQLLTDGNEIYVVEFSARTGGGVKFLLIEEASGVDIIKFVVDLTEGKKDKPVISERKYKYLVNEFIYCCDGVFDKLLNFDELKAQGIISDYYLFKWQGAKFSGISNSGDRVAGFTIKTNDVNLLIKNHNIAKEQLKVIDINGNDIMKHELLCDIDPGFFK